MTFLCIDYCFASIEGWTFSKKASAFPKTNIKNGHEIAGGITPPF